MNDEEKLKLLEELLELDKGELSAEMALEGIELWDSMAQLSFIAMVDDEFGKSISGEAIAGYKTVQDLLDAMTAE